MLHISKITLSAAHVGLPSVFTAISVPMGPPARNAPLDTTSHITVTSVQLDTTTQVQIVIQFATFVPLTALHAHPPLHVLPVPLDSLGLFAMDVHLDTPLPPATHAILTTIPQEEECAVRVRSMLDYTAASALLVQLAKHARLDGKAPTAKPAILDTPAPVLATPASPLITAMEQDSVLPVHQSTPTA
jgi:hypothetical protein